nr:hypothetical protein DBT45_09165 [Aerococcus tenax]
MFDFTERRRNFVLFRHEAVGARRASRARGEKALHDPVFERMESDGGKTPALAEQRLGAREPMSKLAKLVIDENPERLKGPRRGMNAVLRAAADDAGDRIGQRQRAVELRFGPRLHDRLGDGARPLLLAIDGDDAGKIGLVEGVDDIGGRKPLAAHAHVERTVLLEGEAAFRLIELHG